MNYITKDNKGITIIALIITVIIMLILLSVATYTGANAYKNAKVSKFVTKMQLLQSKIDDLSNDEIEDLDLDIASTEDQVTAIQNAYNNHEISSNNPNSYKVFEVDDILNILNVENIQNEIMVNFETREIVSTIGVEYNNGENVKTYYTQYLLPNGQKVYQGNSSQTRTLSFDTTQSLDGLNCTLAINNVSISNGTLMYGEIISEENSQEEIVSEWKRITNYSEENKTYSTNIAKSGRYKFKLQDNTDQENTFDQIIKITTTNKPKTNTNLTYNYANDSDEWAQLNGYVWIPRFVYKLDGNEDVSEVKFIKGNSNIATDKTYIDNNWILHNKFTKDDKTELTGIWISITGIDLQNKTELDMKDILDNVTNTLEQI